MIFTGIINLAYYILHWLIALLPVSGGFPTEAHTALISLGGYLGIFSPLVPLTTLLTTLTLIFSIEIGIFGFKTIKWIISHIPFVGGRG